MCGQVCLVYTVQYVTGVGRVECDEVDEARAEVEHDVRRRRRVRAAGRIVQRTQRETVAVRVALHAAREQRPVPAASVA